MKIGPHNSEGMRVDGRTVGPDRAPAVRGGSGPEPVVGPGEVDRVSVSGQGQSLVGTSIASPFDEKKVEEVRRAIAEGRFPVDAKRVAERLLAESAEMLAPGRGSR